MSSRSIAALVAAVILSFAAKVTLASRTYGATDVLFWEVFADQLQQKGASTLYREGAVLYREGGPYFSEEFNHPPFMTRILALWTQLAAVSGQPFRFWLRLSSAFADVLSVLLLVGIMRRTTDGLRPGTLLLVALSPVCLLVSGFHGNTDPVMVSFVLLSVYLIASEKSFWLAGAALGMAMNFKIMPVVFVPAVLLFLPTFRKRLQFAAGAAGAFLAASLPLILQDPLLIWRHVFGYTPQAGVWGLSRFAAIVVTADDLPVYARTAKYLLLVALLLGAAWMNLRAVRRPPMELQFGVLTFLFVALTPGFGVQYLAWLTPWTALLRFRHSLYFQAASGLFLFSYYNRAAQAFPWYLANSAATPVWYGSVVYLGLLCWVTICWLTVIFWQKANREI
ncbi:MAG: glycosyltransferase family 39 protein [Bryobacteraceae bacterium]